MRNGTLRGLPRSARRINQCYGITVPPDVALRLDCGDLSDPFFSASRAQPTFLTCLLSAVRKRTNNNPQVQVTWYECRTATRPNSTRLRMLPAHDCPARRLSRTRSGKCLETLRPVTGAKPEVIHLGMSTTDWCGVCLASTFRNVASTFRTLASTFRNVANTCRNLQAHTRTHCWWYSSLACCMRSDQA